MSTESNRIGWGNLPRLVRLLAPIGVVAVAAIGARTVLWPGGEPAPLIEYAAADGSTVLVADTAFPREAVELLWLQGRTAGPAGEGHRAVLSGAGNVLVVDEDLRVRQPRLHVGAREVRSATRISDGWWIVTGEGEVMQIGDDGEIRSAIGGLFDFADLTPDAAGDGVWLVRSSELFSFRWDPAPAPLLIHVRDDQTVDSLGQAVVPQHVLLREMANAGHLAVRGDTLYYAPFIRDELIALTTAGDTLWRVTRDLPQSTAEPRFEISDGEPVVDYHPVNLGLTFGPDGLLYLLSTPGFTTSESRLDVYQPATGNLVRTAQLNTALPSLAVNPVGRLYQFDDFRLLSGVAVADREAFPSFDLELIRGGSMRSDELRGGVTLINVWASWCEPCREEMPALDSLQRSIDHAAFRFVTLNEDVDPDDAADFLDEFGFTFPAALGRGNMKSVYHYRGLPLTLLVDRDGQIVQQWIGFAGHDQIAAIRTVIDAELARGPDGNDTSAHAGMHH